jgi:translocation and assembly module TamB
VTATGSAVVATDAPWTLRVAVDATQPATAHLPAWQAHATLDGPLAGPALAATLQAPPATTLDVRTALRPFDAWPLGRLEAHMQALDVSALAPGAPVTSLSGDVVAETRGMDRPAQAPREPRQ